MKNLAYRLILATSLGASFLATGCAEPADASDFVSDNPNGGGGGGDTGLTGGESTDGGTATGGSDTNGDPTGGDDGGGEQEILEADIVQIEGDRLYALSQYSGLSVIDVSTPDALPVLGRFRASAMPFEMYVDQGQVFVMFTNYGTYEWDETLDSYAWHEESKLIALDATDPAAIQVRGEFDLPGAIQDSRRIGDILYLVTYENGYCWGCSTSANTTITSLDISNQAKPTLVDQLTFADIQNEWDWGGSRSVSSTTERMYVAGTEWSDFDQASSTIDVVDISDPSGNLQAGASVPVAGQITSRWQMDEHEGVLRVVSQPGFWGSDNPPVIETFQVTSASEISPLGSTEMVLPRPESLRSVRFDGTRGYAITFEQTDPLFTLDLSDPLNPLQVGELEIPGWVYHMEPRGDQILALGYDQSHPDGSINVSLFDVSIFDQPALQSRVHFGGDWADFGEDQNRIHKAFNILDELGMLLVPYSGWDYTEDYCHGTYKGGVQIIDWVDDTLTLRGVADARGRPRRALYHDERVLSVSDKAVQSFDITDRDNPAKTAELALATNVNRAVQVGGRIIRLALDWWTNDTYLEVGSVNDPENPEPLGRLSLNELHPAQGGFECEGPGFYGAEVFAHEGHVYLVYDVYEYTEESKEHTRIDVFDVQDPFNPSHVNTLDLPFFRGYGGGYLGGVAVQGRPVVQLGDALVMARTEWDYDELTDEESTESWFEVVSLQDPANPQHTATVSRPDGIQHGDLQLLDGRVVSWHMQKANASGTKVRFYMERLGLDDPSDPAAEAPVNVPGVVVAYREDISRAATVDFQLTREKMPEEDCWSRAQVWSYDQDTGECILVERDLNLLFVQGGSAVLLDDLDVEGSDGSLQGVVSSDDRLFVHVQEGSWGWYDETEPPTHQLVTIADLSGNDLAESSRQDLGSPWFWLSNAIAEGTRLVFQHQQGLAVLDTTNPANPDMTVHALYGQGCQDLSLSANTAYCAMGEWGLQAVEIP